MKKVSLIIFVSFVFLATSCDAKKEPVRIVNQILPKNDKEVLVGNKYVNSKTGIPASLSSIGFKAESTTPEAIAREYLTKNISTFQLKNSHLEELKLTNIREGLATTTVRFKQYYQGIEVYNSDIAISYNKNNTVNFVTNQLKPVQDVNQSKSLMKVENAKNIALTYLGDTYSNTKIKSKDVIFLKDDEYVRAYKIETTSDSIQGDWLFVIDAKSGKIYIAIDTAAYQNASATVFDPDPLSTSGSGYVGNFRDNNDTTNSDLNGELFAKDLDLDTSGGIFFLKSPWAQSIDDSAPNDGVYSQNNSNFDYNRQDAAFESSNTFYHLDTYLRFLNTSLGLNVKPYQYTGGVRFDAHALNGADNSDYRTNTGSLRFGEGCVDDAEDADVIIHELGHGIHDWVTNGGLSQVEGLSEGTGDYFAQSYSRSRVNQVWNSNQPAYHYMFSWDGHNQCWSGRTTNYGLKYPAGLSGSIHTSGQIWATCLMKVWDQIGAENTDTIVVEGLAMTGSNTNQPQAAQAVLQAAADIGMTQHLSTIQSTFNSCGYNVSVEIPSLIPIISMSGEANVDNVQNFSVSVEGGTPPYKFAWDVNNDSEVDGIESSVMVDYQKAFVGSVMVTVTDAEDLSANAILPVNIIAPSLEVQNTGTMTQVCGNNDAFVDPGERWQVPVTLQNNGFVTANNAYAVFAKGANSSSDEFNLETPLITIGTMPVSAQHNAMVEFSVVENAQCGSSLNIQMQAAVYNAGFNQGGTPVVNTTLGNNGSCNVVNSCSPNSANDIIPTNGLWFNDTRSGNGSDMYYNFDVDRGDSLVAIHYTALPNRSPIWYITGDGSMQNNQADYAVTRLSYDGPFQSSDVRIDVVGQTLTTLIDSNNAIQTRTINGNFSAELIKSFDFGGAPSEQRTGLWYNPGQSGSGFTIGTQASSQVNISYLYDNAGQPYWLIGSGANNDAETLNMDYFDVFCPHCPKVPNIQSSAGTLRINYDGPNNSGTLESMQININNDNHTSQWNRTNLPLSLLTPQID